MIDLHRREIHDVNLAFAFAGLASTATKHEMSAPKVRVHEEQDAHVAPQLQELDPQDILDEVKWVCKQSRLISWVLPLGKVIATDGWFKRMMSDCAGWCSRAGVLSCALCRLYALQIR